MGSADGTAIAVAGDIIMLVWPEGDGFRYRRFLSDGSPLNHETFVRTNGRPVLSVAANRELFFIAWSDTDEYVRAFRVDRSGLRLDGTAITISGPNCVIPRVASDGYAFLVTWARFTSSTRFIFMTVLDVAAAVISSDGSVEREWVLARMGGDFFSLAVTWTGSRYAVAYAGGNLNQSVGHVALLAPNGVPLSTTSVTTRSRLGGDSAFISSVAGNGEELVVFTPGNGWGQGAFVGRNRFVVREGRVVPGAPLPEPFSYGVFDGSVYVVAPAPVVSLGWPFVAVADRGAIHIVSTIRRRTIAAQ